MSSSKQVTFDGVALSDVRKVRRSLHALGYKRLASRPKPLNADSGNIGTDLGANPLLTLFVSERLDDSYQILHQLSGCDGHLSYIPGIFAENLNKEVLHSIWYCKTCDTTFINPEDVDETPPIESGEDQF